MEKAYFAHESAYVDDGCQIGRGTKIWHFCHIMKGAVIGERCIFGQNVLVADGVVIGNNVKVQNNVSIYTGTTVEDDAFLGPSCVLTNVSNPRSQIVRHELYEKTLIRRGQPSELTRPLSAASSWGDTVLSRPGRWSPRACPITRS